MMTLAKSICNKIKIFKKDSVTMNTTMMKMTLKETLNKVNKLPIMLTKFKKLLNKESNMWRSTGIKIKLLLMSHY